MEVIETEIHGVLLIKPKVFGDHRGFFCETYNKQCFADAGLVYDFIQDNQAFSRSAGVLRGLHYQSPPCAQSKLVRVSQGAVFDVVVDLRKSSPTFGQWYKVELSGKNFFQLLVPAGMAHGYMTLEPDTELLYKVDALYAPEHEGGISWNDPVLQIKWPSISPILSDKDKILPQLSEIVSPFE